MDYIKFGNHILNKNAIILVSYEGGNEEGEEGEETEEITKIHLVKGEPISFKGENASVAFNYFNTQAEDFPVPPEEKTFWGDLLYGD